MKAQRNKSLGIQAGSPWDGKKNSQRDKEKRAQDRPTKDNHSRRNAYGIWSVP